MANRAFMNFGHMYANLVMPAMISCQISVDSTSGEGCSVKSNGYVKNCFMHSSSPSSDNPNPASGIIWVQLTDNYVALINAMSSVTSPLSGSNLAAGASALTPGNAYVITSVGTTTAAEWHALGLPAGLTPAVGMNFIALLSGSGSGSGQVQAPIASGIDAIEVVPNPQEELGPQGVSNQGAWIMLQALNAGSLTAPADGSIINLTLLLDNSSVTVDGL